MILSGSGEYSDSYVSHLSSPRRDVVLSQRREVVPVLGKEEAPQVGVALEVHSEHLEGLAFVVLGAGPDLDERWARPGCPSATLSAMAMTRSS